MIAIDTSAVAAILKKEKERDAHQTMGLVFTGRAVSVIRFGDALIRFEAKNRR